MTLLDITVRTPDGDVHCKGLPAPVPGLYVVDDATAAATYSVVHTSGVGIGLDFPDPESALAAAIAAGVLLDWSQSATQIHATLESDQDLAGQLAALVARTGGHCSADGASAEQCAEWSQP